MIPLPPDKIRDIWKALEPFDFSSTHGAFLGQDVRDVEVKRRVWESVRIQIRAEGHEFDEAFMSRHDRKEEK